MPTLRLHCSGNKNFFFKYDVLKSFFLHIKLEYGINKLHQLFIASLKNNRKNILLKWSIYCNNMYVYV